ncbi:hypothetical protein B0T25DRAFT_528461 [Lasiosphaeria hispida]|uniref:Uncharacterized protein n=1 Tax=Lasiosphaeria hispida TaxID=260671 RepID=A0AAJ0HVQ6_9PEZI|nr:hypothetical protein B0T25DRAFT_528461 [Lasiosphaeria hispida]
MDSMALSSTRPPTSPSTPPPRLSINRLMALYPRERLQVHPLRWSDRQLDLIGCRIHGHDETAHGAGTHESTVTTQTTEATSCRPDPYTRFLADRLSRSFDGHGSLLADTVLNLIWPIEGQTLVNLNQSRALYFAQQPRASLPFCRVSVSVPGPDPEIISLACVDYHDTLHMRQKYFRPSSRSYKTDFPAWWRSGILYARHIPKKPEKDPVLVALIVALAQHEHRQAAVQPPPPDSSFTVRVLVFGDGWPKPIHVYVACVQARFLDKLDFPSREPAVDSGLDIDHWRIAAEPFQTLPYRVSRVLRPGHYQGTHTGSLGEAWGRAREKRKQEGDGTLDEHGSATKKKKR